MGFHQLDLPVLPAFLRRPLAATDCMCKLMEAANVAWHVLGPVWSQRTVDGCEVLLLLQFAIENGHLQGFPQGMF